MTSIIIHTKTEPSINKRVDIDKRFKSKSAAFLKYLIIKGVNPKVPIGIRTLINETIKYMELYSLDDSKYGKETVISSPQRKVTTWAAKYIILFNVPDTFGIYNKFTDNSFIFKLQMVNK